MFNGVGQPQIEGGGGGAAGPLGSVPCPGGVPNILLFNLKNYNKKARMCEFRFIDLLFLAFHRYSFALFR
jgi:hypothetical protein